MEKYIPDIYQKSIYTIDYEQLRKRGIKCILFDIDNTLVPVYSKEIDDKLRNLFLNIKSLGFDPIIYSNNSFKRIELFKANLGIDGYSYKTKIDTFLSKYKEPEIAIVGNQMLTNIVIGNKVGITTILVNPISKRDRVLEVGKRNKEKHIMDKLRTNNLFVKGRYYG